MGVVQTDQWIEEDYLSVENKILSELKITDSGFIANLRRHGMATFTASSNQIFREMKKKKIWEKTKRIYKKYQAEWNGPEVAIFLFPAMKKLFSTSKKSGLAFKEMIFLFIPFAIEDLELEALFVHEYHHTTRLNKIKQKNDTLIDTLIMEGLAEKAVEEYCGMQYLAPWTIAFDENDLQKMYENVYKPQEKVKKNVREHNELLYGTRIVPKMAGYAVGFYLVNQFLKEKTFTTREMLSFPSTRFVQKSSIF